MKVKKYLSLLFFMAILLILPVLSGCKKDDKQPDDSVDTVSSGQEAEGDPEPEESKEPEKEELGENEIAFSMQGSFYKEDIDLEILSSRPCKIYYTTDGTNPDETKELYSKAIKLSAVRRLKTVSVKAKGYFEDGTESETIVHTYFLSTAVDQRFDTLVFSVTTDPYNLFDYEYGIFVEGKLRDEHIKNNPYDNIEPNDPANYNMRGRESEREVFLEVFEADGSRIAAQKVGIRTYGGWSRANLQKSIKIFARKEYDEINNKLRYEFFPGKTAANGNGTILDSFKRLVLRNCGNDNGFAFIRDELFQTLAAQAGYQDYEAVRPAVLYVNGDYRGVYWLHENYSDGYFEENYGEYTGTFEILEGGENYKAMDDDGENTEAIDDYETMYYTYSRRDLTDENNFKELSKLVDVENYLSYYALQVYIGNEDWPHNNYKTYRYYPAEGEEYREAPFDGKWRYLFHDLDFSFGIYGTGPQVDNIQKYVGANGELREEAPLFSQLMRRADCREIFIKKTLDLINGAFSPDNINNVLDRMNASRINELSNMYNKNLIADWVQPDQLEGRLEDIRSYGRQRAWHIITKYKDFFDLGEIYRLKVEPAGGSELKINSFRTQDLFEGSYYTDYATKVTATLPAGKEFDHWLVNGEKQFTQELIITSDMIKDKAVNVTLVLKEKPQDPKLLIRELSAEGDNDYIILFNPYDVEVSTEGYTVTDDASKPDKLMLSAYKVQPGEEIMILCETNPKQPSAGELKAEFNLKIGEKVTLYQRSKVVDEVLIPDLENDNLYQRDLYDMRFYEVHKSEEN